MQYSFVKEVFYSLPTVYDECAFKMPGDCMYPHTSYTFGMGFVQRHPLPLDHARRASIA